ncbi:hypothetical protein [Streptomyces noursei]|uniref:hypothetical protein n=1 Tax=Streptomyces noursei TaxID=1971 RepID=UPI001679C235|nr:hypothetical protein [Streptomyces noursei]MCZ1015650.1 hypothetical protein [Streptomyces noursei]GGW89746.1 hypothetical protein GCM10010341_08270 [Streptomyces noursei]
MVNSIAQVAGDPAYFETATAMLPCTVVRHIWGDPLGLGHSEWHTEVHPDDAPPGETLTLRAAEVPPRECTDGTTVTYRWHLLVEGHRFDIS